MAVLLLLVDGVGFVEGVNLKVRTYPTISPHIGSRRRCSRDMCSSSYNEKGTTASSIYVLDMLAGEGWMLVHPRQHATSTHLVSAPRAVPAALVDHRSGQISQVGLINSEASLGW
jgi:hypothetical protein